METSSQPAWLSAVLSLGPHALWIAFFVFAVVFLRDPLAELLRRLSKASTPIATFEIGASEQQSTEAHLSTAAEAAAVGVDATRGRIPKWIPGSTPVGVVIPMMGPYLSGQKPRNDEVDLAIYWMASWGFESTFRLMWGSQIQLLKSVDVAGEISIADARTFYETSRQKGNKGQTFEQYIGYVFSQGMLSAKPDGSGYLKTAIGHQFLVYLQTQSVPINRPL